jgi:hypothetical protein
MSLWLPPSQQRSSEITSAIELHDSDILKIERGPYAWAQDQQGKSYDIDQFAKDLTEQFAQIGFGVVVQVWTTSQAGTWAFQVEIQRRLTGEFDPDRQVHEVVNNILNLPGQEGWINTGEAMKEHDRQQRDNGHRH